MEKITEYHYVQKGWGWERWLWNESYCGKILHFYKGKKLSWHRHGVKDEFFWQIYGQVLLRVGWDEDIMKAEEHVLGPGDGFHIPTGLCHQVLGLEESEVIEFSTHHRDDDSIRIIKGD